MSRRAGLRLALVLLGAAGSLGWLATKPRSRPPRPAGPISQLPDRHQVATSGALPLSFEVNQGQFDPRVLYAARSRGGTLFFTREGLTMALPQFGPEAPHSNHPAARFLHRRPIESVVALRMAFDGANREPEVEPLGQLPGIKNYFIGRDPEEWHTHVPIFAKVAYRNLYPGIDLIFYGTDGQLEYDLDVSPGANPDQIRLRFEGAESLSVIDGDLLARAGPVELRQPRAHVYDRSGTRRQELPVSYRLDEGNWVSFDIPKREDQRRLLIDPVLAYSTFLGGSGASGDYGGGIAIDSSHFIYVTGEVFSTDFPTTDGGFRPSFPQIPPSGLGLSSVTKFDPNLSSLVYSTYLGGSQTVDGGSFGGGAIHVIVNDAGRAYVVGYTDAPDFPVTAGAAQTVYGGGPGDGYVLQLSPDGASLVYATLLGGSDDEQIASADVDGDGNLYAVGATFSSDFPTSNAFQPTFGGPQGGSDAFFAKLNPSGTQFLYSSYLGGSGSGPYIEDAAAVEVDALGEPMILGHTNSSDFPTGGNAPILPFHPDGGGDAYLAKVASDGQGLVYVTFLGGNGLEYGWDLALDATGDAFVVGHTGSTDFPVTGGGLQLTNRNAPAYSDPGPFDGFISLVSPAGALLYSTYLGGSGDDRVLGVALDADGHAYIAGITTSGDLPGHDALRGERDESLGLDQAPWSADGGGSFFLADLSVDGGLSFLSYLGGSSSEYFLPQGSGVIAVDSAKAIYFSGASTSQDFPVTQHAFQRQKRSPEGAGSAVVVKIIPTPLPATISSVNPNSGPAAGMQFVHVSGLNLSDQCGVDFGGVTNSISNATTTEIFTTAGPHAPGVVDVMLTCAGSPVSVLTNGFTFIGDGGSDAGPGAGSDAGGGNGGTPSSGCGYGSANAGALESALLAAALLTSIARRRRSHGAR